MPKRPSKHAKSPPRERKERREFLPGGIAIIHDDADILVVDKPAGMLTAGLPGEDVESVFRAVKSHVREQVRRRGTQVWILHRLDKEAAGLLVFAKTEKAFAWLKEEFRSKRAHRLYAAVVEGEISGDAAGAGAEAAPSGPRKFGAMQPLSGTVQSFLVEDD